MITINMEDFEIDKKSKTYSLRVATFVYGYDIMRRRKNTNRETQEKEMLSELRL